MTAHDTFYYNMCGTMQIHGPQLYDLLRFAVLCYGTASNAVA